MTADQTPTSAGAAPPRGRPAEVGPRRGRRPRDIGTIAESATVRYLQANGFPHAERRALRGAYDCGDVTGCPGLVFEVKGGQAARTASDGQVSLWLEETETERVNARADIGILVLQRGGIGPANAGRWWAVAPYPSFFYNALGHGDIAIRLHLADAVRLLRANGYGEPEVTP
jgi:hypothetical protein